MNNNKLNVLAAAVFTAVGGASVSQTATAEVLTFNWTGTFTWLDSTGVVIPNNSIPGGGVGNPVNKNHTPISGTLSYDTITGTGTATVVPFEFWGAGPTLPFTFEGINLQAIGDGMGGTGTLIMANMLESWVSESNVPVSLVWDAAGFLQAVDNGVPTGNISGIGAAPAIDGTYTGFTFGYIQLGPTPLATTSYDTTNINGCAPQNCIGINPSGGLPLLVDTTPNINDFDLTTPTLSDLAYDGVGGSPVQEGNFPGFNNNINISTLTLVPTPPDQVTRIRSWTRSADTAQGTETFYVETANSPGNWQLADSNVYWGIANLLQTAYTASFTGDLFLGPEALNCRFCPASSKITAAVASNATPVANTIYSITALEIDGLTGWASINVGGTQSLITTNGDSVSTAMAALTKGVNVTASSRGVYVYNATTNMLELQPGWLQDLITN